MTTLFVYKQYIEFGGAGGFHITLSEKPPDKSTLRDAECLGSFDLAKITSSAMDGESAESAIQKA